MILKYFLITIKDADGFAIPWTPLMDTAPEMYTTASEAQENLDFIVSVNASKLAEPADENRSLFDRIRGYQTPHINDVTKKRLRHFNETASVREVMLTV